jgi:hypothetical protein
VPLAADAYAEIAPPMLTCVQKNDGYQFELMVQVAQDEREITKVRVGPYNFQDKHRPRPILGGLLSAGGPESAFWMHVSSPPGWSRIQWEIANDEPDAPVYLSWTGHLIPGATGVFRFLSMYKPGGLRAGLIIYRGADKVFYGVTGPNYERFEVHTH